jgi:hypothetical protein
MIVGDWWAYGESRYGDRKSLVTSDGWEGPEYQTCMAAGWVSRRFETLRRRKVLAWSFHQEVAVLDPQDQDSLGDSVGQVLNDQHAHQGRPRQPAPGSRPVDSFECVLVKPNDDRLLLALASGWLGFGLDNGVHLLVRGPLDELHRVGCGDGG